MAGRRQYHYMARRSRELQPNHLLLRKPAMKSLMINDLPRSEELDSAAMSAIQGGRAIAPGIALKKLVSGPSVPGMLDPFDPYGTNGFVLPDGAAD
jgi:hypothetical protein